MRIPRRHRVPAPAPPDELFSRLGAGGRFRFAAGAESVTAFGADPVRVVEMAGDGPLDFAPLRRALPRVAPGAGGGFPGGAVGFLTYEEGWANEGLSAPTAEPGLHGRFGVYDTFAVCHPAASELEIVSWGLTDDGTFDERTALRRAGALEERLRGAPADVPVAAVPPAPEIRASLGPAEHAAGVAAILDAIERGDIYQGNLTVRFDATWTGDAAALFARLLRDNPAPHAAFLEADDVTIVSCSPERLLSGRGRDVESRPIKGTAPRDPDPALDRLHAHELRASAKDRAELLMITDLVRNDLGKVCAPGTVRVPRLRELESFPHVHHLVSTVRGRLPTGRDALHALAALYPAGSIVGCPKRRALRILGGLEGAPRGVYTGTVGWIGFDRSCDFNVAIRTGWLRDGVFSFGAGGGIVVDSEPEREWEELGWKARAIAEALGAPLGTAARGSES